MRLEPGTYELDWELDLSCDPPRVRYTICAYGCPRRYVTGEEFDRLLQLEQSRSLEAIATQLAQMEVPR